MNLNPIFIAGLLALVVAIQAPAQEDIAIILSDPVIDWRDPAERARAVDRIKAIENRRLEKARAIAQQKGKPLREKLPDGKVRELVGLDDDGELRYVETRNANAAISTGANLLHTSPYLLTGAGLTVGVWDADSALVTHQEFNDGPTSRINNVNNQPTDDHSTHVAGTIAAFGVKASAKGMAPGILIDSYDWTNDDSEMAAAGAFAPGQFDTKVYLSNHSYGFSYGWDNGSGTWTWSGTGTDQNAYDAEYGQYSPVSVSMDSIAINSPYYLIFWAAGNENNDGPSNGNTVLINGSTVTYNSSIHPQNDGDYRNGFETVADEGVAKNLMVIGAANDAVTSLQRDPSKATIASFSSTGPTDDGRIKPDLVANGVGLDSPVDTGIANYKSNSGTSMASPNACGSAALLVALYRDLFGTNAAMRSSTLKGLLIHTASDRGNPGPDYTYGWGLVDVKTAADLLKRQADFPDLESVVENQLSTAQPVQTYSFAWDGVSPIRATLSWTDPVGTGQSTHDDRAPDLVNNLNLKLIAPNGTEYFPYVMPFVGTWTVASMSQPATTGVNNVDNVEQVLVQTPGQAGAWQAVVTHAGALTNNQQNYGLIISGAGTAGAVAFNPSSYTIDEDSGSATITVERIGGTSGAVSVDYATADGTATTGSDFTPASGTLNWADGEGGAKTFNLGVLNDGVSETYEEILSISLSHAIGTVINGTASATVTIHDDEPFMAVTAPNGGEQLNANTLQNITWVSSVGGDVRIELLRNGINYTMIAASTPNDGSFGWTVPIFAPTGSDYRIRITSLSGNESDESNGTFTIDNQQTSGNIYTANMDSNPGWTLQGAWAYGVPKGLEGDPSSGKTGSNVIGYNLDGDYTNDLAETHATTPAIDCSGYTNVQLSFQRWLGIESSTYDDASIQVSNNGTTWTTVWAHSGSSFTDTSWQSLTYDISAVADQQATVYLRWTMGATDSSVTYCGWNIDDVVVSGLGGAENPAGEVAFSSANYTVAENGGTATITVDRNGGTFGAIGVDYATSDGTALAGSDYTSTSGTLNWADGDGTSKTFSVPIINDSDHEDFLETIALTLTNTVGANIAAANPVTLEIQDDDNNAPAVDAGDDQFAAWQDQIDVPGLYYGTVPGNIDETTPNPATQILVDVSSQTENSIAANTTEIYTGNIHDADGQISFTENIDDKARIWIDGVLVLSNDSWSVRTSTANLNLAPGWHTIEIRISNGTGGSGPASGIGIGYDPAGGTAWQTLVDPGDGSFLKVNQQSSGAEATLAGIASDLDGDPLTTAWSLVTGPGSVTFDDPAALDTTATFDAQGVYTLRLTTDDGRGQSSDDVLVTVGVPGLVLTIDQTAISEDGGSSNASVSRLFTVGELVVTLASDDISEATVPTSITIPDGQASANFTITAQDDVLIDGTRTVTITASSPGNPDATGTIDITDDELAILTLEVAAAAVGESDGNGASTATVTRNSITTNEMIVTLGSSDTSEVNVPATVTIPAGQASSSAFNIDAVDDSIVDGTQTVTITASFAGHVDGTDTLDVTDDAPLLLTVVAGTGGDSTTGSGLKDPDGSPYPVTAIAATGYDFTNWTVTSGSASFDNANSASTLVSASSDTTVQANFAIATYSVSYDGNGNDGGTAPADQEKTHGQDLTLADQGSLLKTGYGFSGWNTSANGSGTAYPAGGTYNIDAPVTLYAQWTANSYTVTFDANGGNTPVPATKEVTFDAPYGPLATTDRAGYAFIGWFTQAVGGTEVDSTTVVATSADHTLHAQWVNTLTWDANGIGTGQTNGGGAWLGTNLWWNGSANTDWVAGSNAAFGGPSTDGGNVTLAGPTSVNALIINQHTGTYTLGTAGQTLTINGGINKTLASSTVSIVSPVTLGGTQTWTNDSTTTLTTSNGINLIDNGGFDLTLDGTGIVNFGEISNSTAALTGAGGLTKNGTGRLTVGGVNTGLTGTVTINGGVMQVTNNNEPMGSGNLTLNGGVMSFYWGATYSRTLGKGDNQVRIPGGESGFAGSGTNGPAINLGSTVVWGALGEGTATGFFNPGKFVLGDSGTGNAAVTTFLSGIDLNGTTRSFVVPKGLSSTGNRSTITGAISNSTGTAGLTKEGGGALILNGANTFTGDTAIYGGTLQVGTNNTANGANLNGGNYAGNISIASGATLNIQTNSSQILGGVISGGGGLTKSYSGTLTLGDGNTYTGKTSMGALTTAGFGTVVASSFNSVVGGSASSSLGAPTTVADGTIDFGSTAARGGGTLRYTGPGETTDRVIHFLMNGTGAGKTIENAGSGLLKFTNTPTTGGSTSNDITLRGAANGEFSGGLPFAFRNFTKAGAGTWKLGGVLGHTGTTTVSGGTLEINGSGSFGGGTYANTISLSSASSILLYNSSTAQTLGGVISGSGSLIKNSTGTLILDAVNTYTGATTITGGTLGLGTSGSIASSVSLTISAGAVFDTSGKSSHAIPASQPITFGIDATESGSSGKITADGLDITNAVITYNITGTPDDPVYVLASYTSLTGTDFAVVPAPPGGYALDYAYQGNKIALVQASGPGPVDHFVISAIGSPQTVGTPITGITLTAQDASNNTASGFTGTVTFGGTGGFTGTSANFTAGVLTDVSVTPTVTGSDLTLTVDNGSGQTGSATITIIQTQYAAWSGGVAFDADSNNDGIANGMAWLLGAADPNASANGLLPTFDNTSDPAHFIYIYRRSDAANASAVITAQYSDNLGSWNDAMPGPDIIITPTNDFYGTGIDKVEVKINRNLAVNGKLFARLTVTDPAQ